MLHTSPRYLCCAGGGTYGLMYIGLHRALCDHIPRLRGESADEFFDKIEGFAGVSVGALAALAFMLNLSHQSWREHFSEHMHHMRDILPNPDFTLLLNNFGLDRGEALRRIIRAVIRAGGISEDATFADIRRLLRRDFVTVATDAQTSEPVYFSSANTPTVKIEDAVYMSMCVPLVFVPQKYMGHVMVDGGMSVVMPQTFEPDQTLFVHLDFTSLVLPVTNLQEFCMACLSTGEKSYWFKKHTYLAMRVPADMQTHPCDFQKITPDFRAKRIVCGYANAVCAFYPDLLPCLSACLAVCLAAALKDDSSSPASESGDES